MDTISLMFILRDSSVSGRRNKIHADTTTTAVGCISNLWQHEFDNRNAQSGHPSDIQRHFGTPHQRTGIWRGRGLFLIWTFPEGFYGRVWEVTPRAYVSSLSTRLKIIASDRLWRFISLICFRMGNQINTHRILGKDEHFLDWLSRSYELDCIVKPDRLRHDQLFDHQSHYTASQIGCDNDYQCLCGLVIQGRSTAST